MPASISVASAATALATLTVFTTTLVGCSPETAPTPETGTGASSTPPTTPIDTTGRIAFGRWAVDEDRGLPPALWTANADGSDPLPVGDQRGWYMEWSPDRTHLVFDFPDDRGNEHIATVRLDGSDYTQLTTGTGFFADPAYSPDGATIVFSHSAVREDDEGFATRLWVMGSDGGDHRALLAPEDAGSDWEPIFSPDGSQIAFTREIDRSGVVVSAIHVANADGTDVRAITEFDDYVEHPRWSPDGSTIVYNLETPAELRHDPRNGIWTVLSSGGAPEQLLPSDERFHVYKPDYSPDGSQVLFGCAPRHSTNEDLCVMDADGTDIRQIMRTPEPENHGVWY